MRIALYGRVSRDDKKMEVENQLHELREFAKRSGWQITEEYIDRLSGKTDQRPRFRQMFEDASKRKFDLILFWALDRFSREGVTETLNHFKRLDSWNVGWRSYTEQFFDSTGVFRDAIVALMAALASIERQKISERTKAGLRRAVRQGKTLGRPRLDVDTGRLQKLRDSGLSLRQIAERESMSLSSVVRALSA